MVNKVPERVEGSQREAQSKAKKMNSQAFEIRKEKKKFQQRRSWNDGNEGEAARRSNEQDYDGRERRRFTKGNTGGEEAFIVRDGATKTKRIIT